MSRNACTAIVGVAALMVATAACSEEETIEPDTLTMEDVAGSYTATRFIGDDNGQIIDVLADGGSLELTLSSDGNTTGRVFAPGGGENGEDFDADLTGTWTLTGTTVRFDHAADTFVRDIDFTYQNGQLISMDTAGGVAFDIVMVITTN